MNCVLPEEVHKTRSAAFGTAERKRFSEELDTRLHAMAQPITVLRGALGAIQLRGGTGAESVRYLEISSKQVERLCNLLAGMQSLLETLDDEASKWPSHNEQERNMESASDCASLLEIQSSFN